MSLAKTHARQCSQPHRMKFQQKPRENIFMFSTSITFASLTESNWKIRLFPKVLLNWMENFTTIIIYFSEEQLFYRKCIESFSSLKWVRSSDPEMIYRSQSSTWFMLGSEEGNKSWFFQLALTHTSWGYVLYLLRHNITLYACHFDKYHKMHPLTLWLSTSTLLNVIWNTTIKVRKIILTILRKALFII